MKRGKFNYEKRMLLDLALDELRTVNSIVGIKDRIVDLGGNPTNYTDMMKRRDYLVKRIEYLKEQIGDV